ncbi:MAG: hypothetical protein LQ338_001709 [Usnochroma carphineum]|nr:MAG: hypothetical protein LQ338_001709 [Usnochroma carphineum]
MASVSSLDKDLRNMRLGKYTPQAANEARAWIEESLGERLAAGDLLDTLKDGIALCKLVNLATGPPGVRYKESSMPFVQMENISHFLRACKSPPLNLQAHDIFQTVDLYENKDPAQVLTCIGAFSRRANVIQPSKFPAVIGPRSKAGPMSPENTGVYGSSTTGHEQEAGQAQVGFPTRPHLPSTAARSHLWEVYGYMGGASQGNQGITFGGRRQITTPAPKVPSIAEKERKRREEEAEAERSRQQVEEAERKRRAEREADEERERAAEEQRWAEETRKQREMEKRRIEDEKRKWDEEERRWKEEEETRAREEQEAELRLAKERQQQKAQSDARLTGQFLSQYQADQRKLPIPPTRQDSGRTAGAKSVEELELELERAKEREAQYERERHERMRQDRHEFGNVDSALQLERLRDDAPPKAAGSTHNDNEESWQAEEREYLQREWANHQSQPPTFRNQTTESAPPKPPRPLPTPTVRAESPPPPPQPPRPLPIPQASANSLPSQQPASPTPSPPAPSLPTRPLPSLAPAPSSSAATTTSPPKPLRSPFARPPPSTTARTSSPSPSPFPTTTKPPSSLLDREMELERQRQREWEDSQKSTREAAEQGKAEKGFGPKGESWDVHQYGYLGGDSQNRGGTGIGMGGRRQLVGPRPLGK